MVDDNLQPKGNHVLSNFHLHTACGDENVSATQTIMLFSLQVVSDCIYKEHFHFLFVPKKTEETESKIHQITCLKPMDFKSL